MSGGRAEAMAARLVDTAERLGIPPDGRAVLAAAFAAAMEPRMRAAIDEHHPDFLHPARTALILMDDAGVADAVTLGAAVVTETRDPALRPDVAAVARVGDAVRARAAAVPDPTDADRVLEDLVVADEAVRLIALAERLDHARHLHLRPRGEWAAYHARTCEDYAPAAARTHPVLQRRFTWWCRTFQNRFLAVS